MKVRITKCSDRGAWYEGEVGALIDALFKTSDGHCYGVPGNRYILVADTEPVAAKVTPETKPTNAKDRVATTRLDLSLFPQSALAYGALAFTEGHLKYGAYNWRAAGVQSSIYMAACLRHLSKWYNGEDRDPQTTVPHLANALSCIAVLIDSTVHGNLNDDRPPRADIAGLINGLEGSVKFLQDLYPEGPGRYREKPE